MIVKELVGPRGCVKCFEIDPDDIMREPCYKIYLKGGLKKSALQLCKKHIKEVRDKINNVLET